MKLTNEEVQRIVVRAEDEYERLKDSVHDLYDKNKELLNNNVKLREEKIKLKGIINKTIELLENSYIDLDDKLIIDNRDYSTYELEDLIKILKGADKK